MKKYTEIKDLSDVRRIPRIGKIKLGAKILKKGIENTFGGKSTTAQEKGYPIELPYFLLPDDVAKIHGGKIKNIVESAKKIGVKRTDVLKFIKENAYRLADKIPIMIPIENKDLFFPQSYKMYGGSIGLKCIGNGEFASERIGITSEFKDKNCPCNNLKTDTNETGNCNIKAHLQVILPDVAIGGIYQLDMGSINSIIDINSCIDYIRSIFNHITMIPLILKRVPTETHHKGKKQIHWTVQIMLPGNIKSVKRIINDKKSEFGNESRVLEALDYSDPTLDEPDAIYQQSDNMKKIIDELEDHKKKGKLKKNEIESIRRAIQENDDITIEYIYKDVLSRKKTGISTSDLDSKLKNGKIKKHTTDEQLIEYNKQNNIPPVSSLINENSDMRF